MSPKTTADVHMYNIVRPIAEVKITDPHSAWGFQDQPPFHGSDRLSELGFTNTYENYKVVYDPVINALRAESVFVPHHNLRTGDEVVFDPALADPDSIYTPNVVYDNQTLAECWPNYPQVFWQLESKTGIVDIDTTVFGPLNYTGLHAQLHPGRKSARNVQFSMSTDLSAHTVKGITIFKQLHVGPIIEPLQEEDPAVEQWLCFDIYTAADIIYTMCFAAGIGVCFYKTSAGVPTTLRVLPSSDSISDAIEGGQLSDNDGYQLNLPCMNIEQTAITALISGGFLQIWSQDKTIPLAVECPETSILRLGVRGLNILQAYWSVHPTMFAADSYMISNEKQVGFVPRVSTPVEYQVVADQPLPAGSTIAASTVWQQGTEFRYKLEMHNAAADSILGQNFSYDTPVVRSVTYRISPYTIRAADEDTYYNPSEIVVNMSFNTSELNINANAMVICQNRHGEWANGWANTNGGKGNRAISIDLGYMDDDNQWYLDRRFTGIGGLDKAEVRGIAPQSYIQIACEDMSYVAKEYPLMACPWMDGWCHYYAVRYLGYLCGLTDDQMDFEYETDPFCTNPAHYHLPMGEGGRPLVYFPPETSAWTAMNRIRRYTGHVLFFDLYGKLKYYKWVRTEPGTFKRCYYEGTDFRMDQMQSIQGITHRTSTRGVRTGATIVGINAYGPLWKPIVAHRSNNAALYDNTYPGYKGYRSPMAWADSMFANQQYADIAADNIAQVVSLPFETLTLNMLAQTDLYPLDVIGIVESKTGASVDGEAKPFFITSISERLVNGENTSFQQSITGRLLI